MRPFPFSWKNSIGLALAFALMLAGILGSENSPEAAATATGDDERVAGEHIEFQKRKIWAIERCYESKGIPALGFGFTVVCIRAHDATEYDPAKGETSERVIFSPKTEYAP